MAGIQKTVVVLAGPTGPTGSIEGVNILSAFTGATGQYPQWLQATGATGPNGTLKKVYNIGPTGTKGEIKTVILAGFSGGGSAGVTGTGFNPATKTTNAVISTSHVANDHIANNVSGVGEGAFGVTTHATGKWYLEIQNIAFTDNSNMAGLSNSTGTVAGSSQTINSIGITQDKTYCCGNSFYFTDTVAPNGQTVQIAIDMTNLLLWMKYASEVNWNNSPTANPATGVGGQAINPTTIGTGMFPYVRVRSDAGESNSATLVTGTANLAGAVPTGFTAWG